MKNLRAATFILFCVSCAPSLLAPVDQNRALGLLTGILPAETEPVAKAARPSPPRPEQPNVNPGVPSKSPTERQLDKMYAKAPAAKAEIDALADSIAKETGGRVANAPLKQRDRALEKAIEDYRGDASKVKDIAHNTIVVDWNQYDKAVALLKEQGAKVKNIDGTSDPMGYSGTNAVIQTKASLPAEIQVNISEMIYAKESPANGRAILGEKKYAELAAKTVCQVDAATSYTKSGAACLQAIRAGINSERRAAHTTIKSDKQEGNDGCF
jgi:hypothetical protein